MALTGAVQGIVIFGVVFWYSAVVWRTIDQHFRDEFKKHLVKDHTLNKHLKINNDDVVSSPETTASPEVIPPAQDYAPQGSEGSAEDDRDEESNFCEESTSCSVKTIIQGSEEDHGDADTGGFCGIDESSENHCGG